ncbi:branched-chain amino acid ABC transporter permease [Desulfitobacterium chlororespirans]|uniref:Branched-chain amino acid transport system permease protein n=1 Tax=Desulfitobacterium chlororespirans DSM 11544 TaxID=1121395 RepID=A0A1M7UFX0_9FIRM|nr:branched-chain amino acid ABC transporter permease [Desulfitobacterium chlororespirans]SHN81931.1 branched-chain amino acid transport system permease protein [Desulfitobacterium chlororespirans DSM 11544]
MRDKKIGIMILVFAALCLITGSIKNMFLLDIIVMTCIWAFASQAWNIAGGYSGQFSLGHCGFFGIGAYASTILYMNFGLSPWIGLIIGGLLAGVLGGLYSGICNKLSGHFFSLATLAMGQILYIASIQLKSITKGSMGIIIPFQESMANMIFSNRATYGIIILIMLLFLTLFTYSMQKSRYGYFLYAIRDNERAALSLGVRGQQLKIASFAISAFFTAIAGSFYAQYILFIEPDSTMVMAVAVQIATIAIIGGTGTYVGPLLGASVLIPLSMVLRAQLNTISGLDTLIYGLVLIFVVIFLPDGLLPLILKIFKKRSQKEVKEEAICNAEV